MMTLREYSFEMQAFRLRNLDERHKMHTAAWVQKELEKTKKKGKGSVPAYQKFKDFFDYDAELRKIEGKKDNKMARLANLAASVNG